MAFEKKTYNERVLFTLAPDGKVIEAVVYGLTQVYEDGVPFGAAVYEPPRIVKASEIEKQLPAKAALVADLASAQQELGASFSDIIEAREAEASAVDTLAIKTAEWDAERNAMLGTITALRKQLNG
jgi:hypothetical protein